MIYKQCKDLDNFTFHFQKDLLTYPQSVHYLIM